MDSRLIDVPERIETERLLLRRPLPGRDARVYSRVPGLEEP